MRDKIRNLAILWLVGFCAVFASFGRTTAQTPLTARPGTSADEIVVTAQRIGIPVWRVTRSGATVVLGV